MLRFMLISLLFMSLSGSVFAQTTGLIIYPNEFLGYIRIENGEKEYVLHNQGEPITYLLPQDKCFGISGDGRYIGVFNQGESSIDIFYSLRNELIATNIWIDKIFDYCGLIWDSDNKTIRVLKSVDPFIFHQFYFDGINLTALPDVISSTPSVYPPLPNRLPQIFQNFIYPSPNPTIFLYQRCNSGETEQWGDDVICTGGSDLVIYDVDLEQDLETLDVNTAFVIGKRFDPSSPRRYELVSGRVVEWSLDGQYLAFGDCGKSVFYIECEILIYDTLTDSYIETYDLTYNQNIWRRMQWSDNNILMLWISRPFSEEYVFNHNGDLNFFLFAHVDEGLFINSRGIFDSMPQQVIFAPDARAIAFRGKERINPEQPYNVGAYPYSADLILISTTTGEHTVIDTDVTEIITWRSICDFTVSDATSLISTMQTEPYSVICLDENVTYTLTAPLPTITGDITIIGNGAQIVMTGTGRVFDVASTGGLTLKNITVSGGNAVQGGAIYNAGELTLENVMLDNNSATDGGAIYNVGNLEMDGGALQNNTAVNFGGGIYNLGELDVDGVNIRDNDAPEGSGVYQGE